MDTPTYEISIENPIGWTIISSYDDIIVQTAGTIDMALESLVEYKFKCNNFVMDLCINENPYMWFYNNDGDRVELDTTFHTKKMIFYLLNLINYDNIDDNGKFSIFNDADLYLYECCHLIHKDGSEILLKRSDITDNPMLNNEDKHNLYSFGNIKTVSELIEFIKDVDLTIEELLYDKFRKYFIGYETRNFKYDVLNISNDELSNVISYVSSIPYRVEIPLIDSFSNRWNSYLAEDGIIDNKDQYSTLKFEYVFKIQFHKPTVFHQKERNALEWLIGLFCDQ